MAFVRINHTACLTEKITFRKHAGGGDVAGKTTAQKNGEIQKALKGKKMTQEMKRTKTHRWVTLPLKVIFKF